MAKNNTVLFAISLFFSNSLDKNIFLCKAYASMKTMLSPTIKLFPQSCDQKHSDMFDQGVPSKYSHT
jgi:hypothetical protein